VIFLGDADVILKLSACRLHETLPTLFSGEEGDIAVLGTAKYRFYKMLKRNPSDEVLKAAVEFCENHIPAPQVTGSVLFQKLLDSGIDAGEAALFAAASEHDGAVFTGDRRAILQIATNPDLEGVRSGFAARAICFEHILLKLEATSGFEVLRRHAVAGMDTDGMLRLCFRSGLLTEKKHAMECLRSYLHRIEEDAADLIYRL